jgi:ADP-ribose pyrophosphatase
MKSNNYSRLKEEGPDMDISFKTEAGRFNYRVAGIITNGNKLLIMRDEHSPIYYIPGGRVHMNELSEEAIVREIKEELECDVKVNRMLWVHENFFHEDYYNEDFHEICFYYLLDMLDDRLLQKGDEFILTENGRHTLTFKWVDMDKIKDLDIYPELVRNIGSIPKCIEHRVERHN